MADFPSQHPVEAAELRAWSIPPSRRTRSEWRVEWVSLAGALVVVRADAGPSIELPGVGSGHQIRA